MRGVTARCPAGPCTLLTGVYDPCCRDKGISVVDMGLLRSVTVARARPRGAAAHLRLVPVRVPRAQ